MSNAKIDVNRCLVAMSDIYVSGIPETIMRKQIIEEAIAAIQKDGAEALATRFLGAKNYAQFGDQRCDCEYGYGPKHGWIVFEVGRREKSNTPKTLGADHVYLLECIRDAGAFDNPEWIKGHDNQGKSQTVNLFKMISAWFQHTAAVAAYLNAFEGRTVDSHEATT